MSERQQKEVQLREALTRAIGTLGFAPDVTVPWGVEDAAFWFSRVRTGKTEAVSCRLQWKPQPILLIHCFVSEHKLDVLARRGLEENAAAFNLFNYQTHILEREADELLPQVIRMDPPPGQSWEGFVKGLAERIAFELDSVPGIWEELSRRL